MTDKKINLKDIKNIKNILIKDATILSKAKNKEFISDILIENGFVKSTDKIIDISGIKYNNKIFHAKETGKKDLLKISQDGDLAVIFADGNTATSSFMDMHVHLREPGDEEEEDINSGVAAARSGGITALCCMPNTKPVIDSEYLVNFIKMKAQILEFDIFPAAAMTLGLEGTDMTDFGILMNAGAIALSDDGKCVQDAKLMYEIMKYAKYHDILLILHEEDYNFSKFGLMHEGYYSAKLGLDGISSLSEDLVIARDIMLAEKTGAKIHITHLSSKKSVEIIKNAKDSGINVTCDVTPHHIFFNDSSIEGYNTNLKVNPPIRGMQDQEALIEGLKTGVIDAIASDHAPHLENEKNTTFSQASNGVIGMETLFKAAYTKLCIKENFNFGSLLELLTVSPRRITGVGQPCLEKGRRADIVILDRQKQAIFNDDYIFSKSKNSAFKGQELNGEIICTIDKGKIVFIYQG